MTDKALDRLGFASTVTVAGSMALAFAALLLRTGWLFIPAGVGFVVFLVMFLTFGFLAAPGRRR